MEKWSEGGREGEKKSRGERDLLGANGRGELRERDESGWVKDM